MRKIFTLQGEWQFNFGGNNRRYLGPQIKCPIFFQINKSEFFRQIFLEALNIKFHGNPSSWSRDDTCGHEEGNGAFRDYAKAPMN